MNEQEIFLQQALVLVTWPYICNSFHNIVLRKCKQLIKVFRGYPEIIFILFLLL